MTNLLSVITGGILAILGGFFGNLYLVKAQERKWEAEQTGLYNRDRAKRLRKLYARMAESAATIEAVMQQRSWVSTSDQTVENRDNRHARMLANAQKQLSKVGGQIMVEPEDNTAKTIFIELHDTFDSYLLQNNSDLTGNNHADKIRGLEKEILKLVNDFKANAQQHLKELDTPPKIGRLKETTDQRQLRSMISKEIKPESK